MRSVLLSMLSILYDLYRDFDVPWALDCLSIPISDLALDDEGTASKLAGGSLNVSPSLSLITCVRIYSSSQANGGLCFLFKFPWLFECGCWVHFNFKFVFSFYRGIWSWFWSCFLIFSFSFDLEVDLCLLFVACVSFFGVGFVVSFSVGLSLIFIFLWSLFWKQI